MYKRGSLKWAARWSAYQKAVKKNHEMEQKAAERRAKMSKR